MSDQSYTIDKVGWHTSVKGNSESLESIHVRFRAICSFLNEHSLTKTKIDFSDSQLTDDFELNTNQLTNEGLEFIKLAYDKWVQGIDRGRDPSDTTYLVKKLNKNGI